MSVGIVDSVLTIIDAGASCQTDYTAIVGAGYRKDVLLHTVWVAVSDALYILTRWIRDGAEYVIRCAGGVEGCGGC